MKYILILLATILFFSCKPNLKIYDAHGLLKPIKIRKDNYYIKESNGSNTRLKGSWVWTNNNDTLLLKSTPIIKKKYGEDNLPTPKKNVYHDFNQISLKYVKDGKVIVDNLSSNDNNCLIANHLEVLTNMFYVYDKCSTDAYIEPPVLMFVGNDLLLINQWNEKEGVFIKKEGAYEVKIPRTITLKRML